MAYKVIWSPAARDDLQDIVVFIARDNPQRAMSFGYQLISKTDRLEDFPKLGRMVPEYQNQSIRDRVLNTLLPAPRTLNVFNGCLSHLLDFTYDSPRAWNCTVNHVVLIR